jgi:thiol-disulfide isomerase/thioredoxin
MPAPWPAVAAFFVLLAALHAQAQPANPVRQMDLATLEKMMTDPANRHMVVAMASWCQPCREELPILEQLHSRYREDGLTILGISLDAGGPESMQPIVDKSGVSFPIYWVGDAAVEKFDIYAVPMLFLIKDGQVLEKVPGKRTRSFLDKKIQKLLE